MKRNSVILVIVALFATCLHAQTLGGTWTLHPAQAQIFQASIQQPVNADGSSVWSTKSTVPVQYKLQQSLGPVIFSSYKAGSTYSSLDFAFSGTVTFDQISLLSAVYQFLTGDCHGGALRWSFNLADGDTIYAYYGNVPAPFNDCTSSARSGSNNNPNNQSGLNLLGANFQSDPRYEMQSNGGTYVSYATVLAAKSGIVVNSVTLVLDAGWGGDQVLTTGYPMNVTVGTSDGSSATFAPGASTPIPVCPSQPATIQVGKLGSGGQYSVDESIDTNVPDQGTSFRIVDCKYMYNIAGKSLGAGQYQVNIFINGNPVNQASPGTIFVLK